MEVFSIKETVRSAMPGLTEEQYAAVEVELGPAMALEINKALSVPHACPADVFAAARQALRDVFFQKNLPGPAQVGLK